MTVETHVRSDPYLYCVVFCSGLTTLAVELSASRLLGSIFGTSNIVWANVIGLIMLYLAAGYFIGGRWADRSPRFTTFYSNLIWAAFLCGLVPLVARPVLVGAASAVSNAEAGLALGSFISVLILFSAPITLLGCASPFAIRLAIQGTHDVSSAGKISGRIYAISTLGSLIGTFLPVLFLIPELGTIRTFLVFAGILYFAALIGLMRTEGRRSLRFLWMPLVVAALTAMALTGPLRTPFPGARLLYEDESAYNYIQVQEDSSGNRYLYLNEGQGIHSQWSPNTVADGHRTWSFFLTAPYFNAPPVIPSDVGSLAIIGLAAGTIARQYGAVYGDIPVDGIEIDPDIIGVGERFFDLDRISVPGLTTYAADGRFAFNRLRRTYSIVAIDAYRPPYIPWHLTTVEFFQEIHHRLQENGVVAINVGRTQTDRRLVDAMSNTLSSVFPSVHAMDVPLSFNTILIATKQPTVADNLAMNLARLAPDSSALLSDALSWGVTQLVPIGHSEILFTDDRASVETLVDSLVVNFLLSSDADQIGAGQ